MKNTFKNISITIGFALLVTVSFLIISITKSHAQNRAWYRMTYGDGAPTFKPSSTDPGKIAYAYQDAATRKVYVYNTTTKLWEESNFLKGELGQTGPEGPKGDPGPQGPQGIPGAAGGSIIFPFTFPEKFGSVHANQTFAQAGKDQSYINTNFPGIGAVTSDPIDWAAWQMAVNEAATTGKTVWAYGEYFINTKKILFNKYFRCITINGSSCYLNVIGTDGSAVLGRPSPIDNGDANIMIQAFVVISGVQIGCKTGAQANRIGIDLGPTYNSVYTKVDCFSLQESIHLRFALNTSVSMCENQYCVKGWTADIGNWPGAGTANSQSNVTTFDHCRFNAASNSDYGIGIYACSGCVTRDCIFEGDKVRVCVDYDAKASTVVKSFAAYNTHVEMVNGCTQAAFNLKLAGGIAVIDGIFGQYASYMVDAVNQGGNCVIDIQHQVYWVPNASTGKYYKNNGCAWNIRCSGNLLYDAQDAVNKFAGTPVNYCNSPGKCSQNTVTVEWVAN